MAVIRLLTIISISLSITAHIHGAEHPEWKVLTALLGKRYDSAEMKAFVREHELRSAIKFDSGSFSPNDRAYSVLFRDGRISSIFLRIAPWPKLDGMSDWTPYPRALPARLTARDSRESVIKKLGQPTLGNARTDEGRNTWVDHELGIWLIFKDGDGPIEELFLSAKGEKELAPTPRQ